MMDAILEVGDVVVVKQLPGGWAVEKTDKESTQTCVIVKVVDEGYIFQRPGPVGTYRVLLKKSEWGRFMIAPAYLTETGDFVF